MILDSVHATAKLYITDLKRVKNEAHVLVIERWAAVEELSRLENARAEEGKQEELGVEDDHDDVSRAGATINRVLTYARKLLFD